MDIDGTELKTFPSDEVRQKTSAPPLDPEHVQLQGPLPVTTEATPVEQRFVEGAEETMLLFAEPQTPSNDDEEQEAFEPPFAPWHIQVRLPKLSVEIDEAEPRAHHCVNKFA